MADEYFRVSEQGAVSVLELTVPPEMDPLVIDRLIESIIKVLDGRTGRSWVLDLSEVAYLNSAGLGLLCNVREKVRQAKGKLVLCGMSSQLVDLFHSCCLERLFTIVKTREDAMKRL